MRSGNLVRIGLESACLYIDGNKLSSILCAEVRLYLALIDLVAPSGELFPAVPRNTGRRSWLAFQPARGRTMAGRNWGLVRYGRNARPPMAELSLERYQPPVS